MGRKEKIIFERMMARHFILAALLCLCFALPAHAYLPFNTSVNMNVGIGSASPGKTLDVNGTVRMTGFNLSTGGQNNYVLTSDNNGNGTWAVAGSSSQWITNAGVGIGTYSNVGIGTITPSGALDVEGTLYPVVFYGRGTDYNVGIGSLSPGQSLDVNGTVRSLAVVLTSNVPSNTTNELYNSSGALYFNGSAVGGGGSSQWITNAGVGIGTYSNVGIGTITPSGALDVEGTLYPVVFYGRGTDYNVGIGSLSPGQSLDVNGTVRDLGEILISNVPAVTTNQLYNSSGALYFNGSAVGGGGSSQWITTTGVGIGTYSNVGIGTVSPGALLDVLGTLQHFYVNSSGNVGIGTFVPNSGLQISKSLAVYHVASASTSITSGGQTIIGVTDTPTSAVTVTLSAADLAPGRVVIIKDEGGSAGTNNITVNTAGGNIDGGSSVTISANYGVLRVYSDGTNWFTF